jgi:hypothetical protein
MRTFPRTAAAILSGLVLLSGCQNNAQPAAALPGLETDTPDPKTDWAQVLRSYDDAGILRNDRRNVTAPADIARLKSFFPELSTTNMSNLHGGWNAWIIIHFHTAAGADTYVLSDYRLYRIGDSPRGDFVVRPGLADFEQHIFLPSAAAQ